MTRRNLVMGFPEAKEIDNSIQPDTLAEAMRALDENPGDDKARAVYDAIVQASITPRLIEGLPEKYAGATLDNWETPTKGHKKAMVRFRDFVSYNKTRAGADPKGCILHGIPGDGKTHASVGMLKELVNQSRRGVWVSMATLAGELRKEYNDEEGEYCGSVIQSLSETPIAVIDDLGVERMTPDISQKFIETIHRRYNALGLTIITSNLSWPKQFEERYGEQIVSRLSECCLDIPLPDSDWRRSMFGAGNAYQKRGEKQSRN